MTFAKILFIINSVKKLFIFISSLFAYLTLPLVTFAQTNSIVNPCGNAAGAAGTTAPGIANVLCSLGGPNIAQTIRNVVIFFIIIAVVVALFYLLYGGVKWITSKGDKTEVEAARNHITAAVVGLIVVFLAIFIISIILSAFGIKWENLIIPSIGSATPGI